MELEVGRPKVQLLGATYPNPIRLAAAAAETCYRPPNASTPVHPDFLSPNKVLKNAKITYAAGHHSCWMHVYLTFLISDVSRDLLHDFAHTFPHYNTDQISQRYRVLTDERRGEKPRVIRPDFVNSGSWQILQKLYQTQYHAYGELTKILTGDLAEICGLRPDDLTGKQPEGLEKKAIELARYVTPVGALAGLYYTINAITLFRLYACANMSTKPWEAGLLVSAMRDEVEKHSPNFFTLVGEQVPKSRAPIALARFTRKQEAYNAWFDSQLDGHSSKLTGWQADGEHRLARGVRSALGALEEQLPDEEAIALAMNPKENISFTDILDLEIHDPVAKAMGLVTYQFMKSLSHTAHSQLQRHRPDLGSTVGLSRCHTKKPDCIVPELIAENPEALRVFGDIMKESWEVKNNLLEAGEPAELVVYTLPSAAKIRHETQTNLSDFRHRQEIRTCLRAQQEAWTATMQEVAQVSAVQPLIGRHFGPPCIGRSIANLNPPCNQGTLYCGLPVWNLGKGWHAGAMEKGYYPSERKMARKPG